MCRNLRLRGDSLKLTYFQLLSSDPIYIPKVGGILSPKLKDISAISDNMYQYYLNILLMDLKMFFTMINRPDDYEKLTDEEKRQTEEIVNKWIKEDLTVIKEEMSKNDAINSGAECMFIEKYPDTVTVYSIGEVSRELCGGPHVSSTGCLGTFKIKKDLCLVFLFFY